MIRIIKTIYGGMETPRAFRLSAFDAAYLAALAEKLGQSQISIILTGLYAVEQDPRERARILAERQVYEEDIKQRVQAKAEERNQANPGAQAVSEEAGRVR